MGQSPTGAVTAILKMRTEFCKHESKFQNYTVVICVGRFKDGWIDLVVSGFSAWHSTDKSVHQYRRTVF
jgi:hypothetical protein